MEMLSIDEEFLKRELITQMKQFWSKKVKYSDVSVITI